MRNYEKPVVIGCDDVAEGVYAASGCYTVTTVIHQTPQEGRQTYLIQVNAVHSADHMNTEQLLTLGFNQPVQYESSAGTPVVSSGNEIKILYKYYSNPSDKIGFGDVSVSSESGLQVVYAHMTDNG